MELGHLNYVGYEMVLTSNFAKCFNEDHRVVIEVSALGLSNRNLLDDHHESFIVHLLLQQILNQRPLQTFLALVRYQ